MNYESFTREELVAECEAYERKISEVYRTHEEQIKLFKERYHIDYWPRFAVFKDIVLMITGIGIFLLLSLLLF